jgi:bifunctional non-homologous end joining protein LigD
MNQQLHLPIDGAESERPTLPVRLAFPIASDGGSPFDDDGRFFEPWWPGAQAFLKRSGDFVEMRTEHLSDPLAVFPELRVGLEHLAADGVIVQGTLLALDEEGRPDAGLLRRRLTGATHADPYAEGAFVASDLPYLDGHAQTRKPFVERRRQLSAVFSQTEHCVVGPGLVGEGLTLGRAVASMGLRALSARRLDGRWRAGETSDAWLRLRLTEAPATPTRPFLVLLEKLPLGE